MSGSAITIAIDGPSGSGKSSVSREVASRLEMDYLDTGAMFRALTWWCLQRRIDLSDQLAVAEAAAELPLRMGIDPHEPQTVVGEEAVDEAIRTPEISSQVSAVATNMAVRSHLAQMQRQIIADSRQLGTGIVVEGRDITTLIAPEAEHRILLNATEEARLRRRGSELAASGATQKESQVRDQVLRRDRDDASVSNFMTPAPGVHGIDTSPLTFEQSVAAVLDAVAGHPPTQPEGS